MTGTWKFDELVAKQFDVIANTHIPDYTRVNEISYNVVKDSLLFDDLIVEVGCSTGNFLQLLATSGFSNLVGTDSSKEMIIEARKKLLNNVVLHATSNIPKEISQAKAVVANWAIQFNQNKEELLNQIYEALAPGGLFVLTEKMCQNPITKNQYYKWKQKMGVSLAEIEMKEESLKGVLHSMDLQWYLSTLSSIGFKEIQIVNSFMNFNTLIMLK